jgi:CO/xanthine dehydrogenase FAD-binding subunit
LARPDIHTTIVAGGAHLVAHMSELVDEVVDLQALGLNQINYTSQGVILGATVTLQSLLEQEAAPILLRKTAQREGPNTLRQVATVGGILVGADKESEFLAALLVCEAEVEIQTGAGPKQVALPHFLRDVPRALAGGIITAVSLTTLGKTASERVARTPADRPIVAAMGRRGPDDKVRLALCGVATTPVLVDPERDIKAAVSPPQDFRGSTEYRRQMAATLVRRVLAALAK